MLAAGSLMTTTRRVGWPAGTNLQIHVLRCMLRGFSARVGVSPIGIGSVSFGVCMNAANRSGPARGAEGWRRGRKATAQSVPLTRIDPHTDCFGFNLRLDHSYLFILRVRTCYTIVMDHQQPCFHSMEGCIPGSAGTRQTHMTLNSERRVLGNGLG